MTSITDAAYYATYLAERNEYAAWKDRPETKLTWLRLRSILVYAQGYSLHRWHKPMFPEKIVFDGDKTKIVFDGKKRTRQKHILETLPPDEVVRSGQLDAYVEWELERKDREILLHVLHGLRDYENGPFLRKYPGFWPQPRLTFFSGPELTAETMDDFLRTVRENKTW